MSPERVVGVGRRRPQRIDRPRDAPLRVVDGLRGIAAPVGLRGLATESVVGVSGGDAGGGTRRDGQATAGDGLGRESRGWGGGRLGRRVGCAVEVGASDRFVAERIDGTVLRNKAVTQPGEAGAGEAHKRQFRRAVLARLPGRTFAPPVAVEQNVPRVVRDDAVRVVPVDLAVEVHVGDGQGSLAERIIAKIGVGQRCRCRIFVQHVSARGDELVRRVVLVGGDEECAAEAGAGFADCAAECVFVGTIPTRGVEAFDRF
mgnify:CR=1 FL=1